MKSKFTCLLALLLITVFSYAQNNKTSNNTKKPLSGIDKAMTEIGFPYTKYNDSVANIIFDGTTIKTYNVMVIKAGTMYVAYLNLSEALNIKIDPSKYKYLLENNADYDFIKIGLTEKEEVFIRYENYVSGFNGANFKNIINMMADAAETMAPKLR